MISEKLYEDIGAGTKRFLSDFLIRSQDFCRPYVYIFDSSLESDGSEDVLQDGALPYSYPENIWKRGTNIPKSTEDNVPVDKWQIVDNSVLFYIAPSAESSVWIEVATTAEEFGDTLAAPSVEKAETAAALAQASEVASAASELASAGSAASALLNQQIVQAGVNSQLLGIDTTNKSPVQYMSDSTIIDIVVETGTNAFSIDNFTLESGSSLTIENNAVYKVI